MNRLNCAVVGFLAAIVAVGLLATGCEREEEEDSGEVPADISGTWVGGATAANGDVEGMRMDIRQQGSDVSGLLIMEHSGSFSFAGTYVNGVMDATIPGSTIHLVFRGSTARGSSTTPDSGDTFTLRLTKR